MGTKEDELEKEIDDAKNYINETLTYWRNSGEDKKVVALVKTAKKLRSGKRGYVLRMINLKKSINALNLIIKREDKAGEQNDATLNMLLDKEQQYNALVEEHGELPKRTKKKV